MKRIVCPVSALIFTLLVMTPYAGAIEAQQPYTFSSLDTPQLKVATPCGINNGGKVAGLCYNNAQATLGFVKKTNGSFTKIIRPNCPLTSANGINNHNEVAGFFTRSDNVTKSFVWKGGNFTSTFVIPSARASYAWGINDNGQVVGAYLDSNEYKHGFTWDESSKKATTFDYPSATQTELHATNNNGDMIGVYYVDTQEQNFVQINGSFVSLSYPGSLSTSPYGINNNRLVAGTYTDSSGSHGFVYDNSDTNYVSLDYPNSAATTAYGINDNSQVAGAWTDTFGRIHPFIANPGGGYSISGTVTDGNGSPLQGILVSLGGPTVELVMTDSNGAYSFTGLANGTYQVTANIQPAATVKVSVSGGDASQSFSGSALYVVAGQVTVTGGGPLAAVNVKLTGDMKQKVVTTPDGVFVFTGVPAGTYTVTPSKAHFSFTPANITVSSQNVLNTNLQGTGK